MKTKTIIASFLLFTSSITFAQQFVNKTKGNTKDHFVKLDSTKVKPTVNGKSENLVNRIKGNTKDNFVKQDSTKTKPTKSGNAKSVINKCKANIKNN